MSKITSPKELARREAEAGARAKEARGRIADIPEPGWDALRAVLGAMVDDAQETLMQPNHREQREWLAGYAAALTDARATLAGLRAQGEEEN